MRIISLSIAVLAAALLGGCLGSPQKDPSVFYLMMPDASGVAKVDVPKCDVDVLPITIPAYMSRSQIVYLQGCAVTLSEFDRWAESPASGFMRAVISVLNEAAPNASLYAYPSVSGKKDNSVALRITIYECIGQMGGDLNFKGQVRMDKIGANAEPFVKEISYSVPCGNTHATYVNAIDTCIKNMSDEIAKGLAQYLN